MLPGMIVALLGGLGMFLLGMVLLTDGLKALAGEALRRILTRFVAGPVSGMGWGALVTALVQSSMATTVTTVGFVSAGLLTFTQAVGVIFGANLGTTSTGWIVSQLGFKVSLGSISPPLVFLGVAARLLSKGRAMHAGTALAGIGLLFIGIDMLQHGMGSVATRLSPGDLPGAGEDHSLLSRAILVGFGFLMAVMMQSSSASMATTLAAVSSGAISLEQAAALIVGQNIGTTPAAVAASIGASAAAKRTALAHVLFNVLTASVAFFALPVLLRWIVEFAAWLGEKDTPTLLAMFHSTFNILGILLLLPLVFPFSRMIEWIIPERRTGATRFLTPAVAEIGPVAVEAARRATAQIVVDVSRMVVQMLRQHAPHRVGLEELNRSSIAIDEVRRFVHQLARGSQNETEVNQHASLLHACDHLARLTDTLRERCRAGQPPIDDAVVAHAATTLTSIITLLIPACEKLSSGKGDASKAPEIRLSTIIGEVERLSRDLAEMRKRERREALASAAAGQLDAELAMKRIDALLWIDRVGYHLWRAGHHLIPVAAGEPNPPTDALFDDSPTV